MLSVGQWCALVAKKAKQMLECVRRSMPADPEVILPLYLALVRPHLGYCEQFWVPDYKRDMELLEQF